MPAAAALASANTAIDALEKGNRVLSQANQVASNLRKGSNIKAELLRIAKTHGRGYLKAYLARNPSLKIHASMALRYEGHVRRVLGNPVRKAKLKRTMRRYKAAKTFVAKVNYAAARGKGKERTDARKMQAILRLAAQNRSRIKRMTEELEGGTPGILIDSRGRFKAGRYVLEPSAEGTPDVLMLKTSERKGRYRRVRIDPAKARRLAAYKKRQRSLELQAKRLRAQRAAVAKKKVRARKKTALRRIRRRLSMMNPVRRARAIRTLSARLRKARQRIMLRRARRARKPMTRQQKIYSRLPSTALSAMRR